MAEHPIHNQSAASRESDVEDREVAAFVERLHRLYIEPLLRAGIDPGKLALALRDQLHQRSSPPRSVALAAADAKITSQSEVQDQCQLIPRPIIVDGRERHFFADARGVYMVLLPDETCSTITFGSQSVSLVEQEGLARLVDFTLDDLLRWYQGQQAEPEEYPAHLS